MFLYLVCLLLAVCPSTALFQTVFCVCENKYITSRNGDVFAATVCDFKHGYITRGDEFVTLSSQHQISVTRLEDLILARHEVCRDKEDVKDVQNKHPKPDYSKEDIIQNNNADKDVVKHRISSETFFGQQIIEINGKVYAFVGRVGRSISRLISVEEQMANWMPKQLVNLNLN